MLAADAQRLLCGHKQRLQSRRQAHPQQLFVADIVGPWQLRWGLHDDVQREARSWIQLLLLLTYCEYGWLRAPAEAEQVRNQGQRLQQTAQLRRQRHRHRHAASRQHVLQAPSGIRLRASLSEGGRGAVGGQV